MIHVTERVSTQHHMVPHYSAQRTVRWGMDTKSQSLIHFRIAQALYSEVVL